MADLALFSQDADRRIASSLNRIMTPIPTLALILGGILCWASTAVHCIGLLRLHVSQLNEQASTLRHWGPNECQRKGHCHQTGKW